MSHTPAGVETRRIPGEPILRERAIEPCALVVFGITGDLAQRKLVPAILNLAAEGALPDSFAVLGVGRSPVPIEDLRARLREAAGRFSRRAVGPEPWDRFAARLEYHSGDLGDGATYAALGKRLEAIDRSSGTRGNRIFYLSTPPGAVPGILTGLHGAGLAGRARAQRSPWSRVVLEKPFGRDLASARQLNALAGGLLEERDTFRIDHFLGKETVQNILVFRFGNAIFEPLWNRKYVDHVQITVAEAIGVEGRGRFYEETGVIRDMVQNHLLQILALSAMEPPVSFRADDVRDEKVQVLRSLRHLDPGDAVLGQYRGYRGEPGVAQGSSTPTYAALRLFIDNWRWQGVPFYLRTGKRLAARVTEVSVHFQTIPLCLFPTDEACQRLEPNVLILRLAPEEGISLRFVSKVPGGDLHVAGVRMDMSYATAFGRPLSDAYERLLLDCLRGDPTLFARRDEVEEAWRLLQPLLEAGLPSGDVPPYEPGSGGPEEADALPGSDGRRWRGLSVG